jgi:foldase protein PrsA
MAAKPKITKSKTVEVKKDVNLKNSFKHIIFSFFLKRKKTFSVFIVLLLLGFIYYLLRNQLIVAIVGKTPVTRFEIISEMERTSGKQTLDAVIMKKLIFNKAKQDSLNISQNDIDAEIKNIKDNLEERGSSFDEALISQNMTLEQLKETIELQKILEKLLSDKNTVTDEEIAAFYDENKDLFEAGAKIEDLKDTIRTQLQDQKSQESFNKLIEELKAEQGIRYFFSY